MSESDAYEFAAKWHDKQAALCQVIAGDEPRITEAIRNKAQAAAIHHAASASGLRLAATEFRRRQISLAA